MKAEDWIKVEDRLPEEGQLCLVRDKRGQIYVRCISRDRFPV